VLSRTLLYLRRKKGKTFTLFALIFLVSTFVTTSFALMHTMNEASTHMRMILGGQIEILQERWPTGREESSHDNSADTLTTSNIAQIMEISRVRSYTSRNSGHVSGISFIEGFEWGELDNAGTIHGINDSGMLSYFSDETLALVAGRHITTDDKNEVIISQTLALQNGLAVGDSVELIPAGLNSNDVASTQAEIVGLFTENEIQPIGSQPTVALMANQIFSSHAVLNHLELANQGEYASATFYIEDPADLPRIVAEIRQLEGIGNLLIQYNDFNYMRIAGDLQTIQNLILILLIGIGVVSAIILALILVLRMRGRVHEVGILLSVGIQKSQIWSGFLLEITMTAMVAFIFSYISSVLLVPVMNQGLLADLPMIYDVGQYYFQSMPLAIYSVVFILILFVVLLTAFISTLLTIRLKPKQILSKMS